MTLSPAALILALLLCGAAAARPTEPATESATDVVERFLAAYNAHDVLAMLEHVHREIRWLSVSGDQVSVEANGADALANAMRDYFDAYPTSRSTIEAIMQAGRFVTVYERTHWGSAETPRTQTALAVYEVTDGRIHRVWYYPAQE